MLRAIFVFHDHGHLIYSENFEEVGNADLISALLSAIQMFANQIKAGDVSSIEMQNYALVGLKSKGYPIRFVSIIDRADRVGECLNFLTSCEKSFVQRFKDDLKAIKAGKLVNTDIFSPWGEDLKDLATDIDFSPIETVMGNIIQDISSKLQTMNGDAEKELVEDPLVADPPMSKVISVVEPKKKKSTKKKKIKKRKKKVKKTKKSPKKKKAKKKIRKKKKGKKKKGTKKKKTSKKSKTKKKGRKKK